MFYSVCNIQYICTLHNIHYTDTIYYTIYNIQSVDYGASETVFHYFIFPHQMDRNLYTS